MGTTGPIIIMLYLYLDCEDLVTGWPGDRVDYNTGFGLVIRVGLISAVDGRQGDRVTN